MRLQQTGHNARTGNPLLQQRGKFLYYWLRTRPTRQNRYSVSNFWMSSPSFTWPGYNDDAPAHRMITAYLAIDIQKSLESVNELMEKIDDVRTGKLSDWERIGNAYCLRLSPHYAEIEEDFSPEPGQSARIPLHVFTAAVLSWRQYITASHQNSDHSSKLWCVSIRANKSGCIYDWPQMKNSGDHCRDN